MLLATATCKFSKVGGRVGRRCYIESGTGKVNCADVIYDDEKTWQKSRNQIDMLIKVYKDQITQLKDMKKQLRGNKLQQQQQKNHSAHYWDHDYRPTRRQVSNNAADDGTSATNYVSSRQKSRRRGGVGDGFDVGAGTSMSDAPYHPRGGGDGYSHHNGGLGCSQPHHRAPQSRITPTTEGTTTSSSSTNEVHDSIATTLNAANINNLGQKEIFTSLGNSRNNDPFHQQKEPISGPASCYCEEDEESVADSKDITREARRKLKEERQRKKERKRNKKACC